MSKSTKTLIGIVAISLACITIIFVSAGALLVNSVESSAEYFITVDELIDRKDTLTERNVRLSGAVIGESIEFDETNKTLSFWVADVPGDFAEIEQQGGLGVVLESAVKDPNRQRIQVVYVGEKPELLRQAAQAIVTGQLHSDGIFYAVELLLRCPSRYEEAVPDQVVN